MLKWWSRSWPLSTTPATGSHHVFNRPYSWVKVRMFNARIDQPIGHGYKWNGGDILYSELETLLHQLLQSIALDLKNLHLLVILWSAL